MLLVGKKIDTLQKFGFAHYIIPSSYAVIYSNFKSLTASI